MLIVSQGKETIVNTETIEIIDISEKFGIRVFSVSGNDIFLEIAKYESLEKAKTELRNIWSAYANGDKVYQMN